MTIWITRLMISIAPMMMTTWNWVLNERHSINPTFSQCICCSLSRFKTSDKLFFITFWTGWWRDQHLCKEGEVYKYTNVSQNRVLLWGQVKYQRDQRLYFKNHYPISDGSCSATPDCSDRNEDGCLCSLNVLCE